MDSGLAGFWFVGCEGLAYRGFRNNSNYRIRVLPDDRRVNDLPPTLTPRGNPKSHVGDQRRRARPKCSTASRRNLGCRGHRLVFWWGLASHVLVFTRASAAALADGSRSEEQMARTVTYGIFGSAGRLPESALLRYRGVGGVAAAVQWHP